jgi:hypothetical protein
MNKQILHQEHGQTLVLIALLLVGMLAFLGLVIDGGEALIARRRSQDASDAGAFAGARRLAMRANDSIATEQAIWSVITNYAQANGIASATDIFASFIDGSGNNICQINVNCFGVPASPLATGVRVTTTLRFQPYFIPIVVGNAPIPIATVAAAQTGSPSAGAELSPMSIKFPCPYPPPNPAPPGCEFHYGDPPYQLFGDPQLAGGFQWVSYECASSANSIEDYLRMTKTSNLVMADKSNTYYNPLNPTQYNTPPPSPNPWICSGPGVQPNNNISAALDCWLFQDAPGCWLPPGPPKPGHRTWTVPVYNQTNELTGANAKYHVVMFAEFEFLGYWFANNQCNWVGRTSERCNNSSEISPQLLSCLLDNQKCIMGRFLREVDNLQIIPGKCNTNGLDICGIGLSE